MLRIYHFKSIWIPHITYLHPYGLGKSLYFPHKIDGLWSGVYFLFISPHQLRAMQPSYNVKAEDNV